MVAAVQVIGGSDGLVTAMVIMMMKMIIHTQNGFSSMYYSLHYASPSSFNPLLELTQLLPEAKTVLAMKKLFGK